MIDTNEIITSHHYPAFVLASAGTGKTELITRKVEHLIINEGVDIDKIALITFTNKATAETTTRLKNKIVKSWQNGNEKIHKQIDKLNMSKISTIHIFCDNILREFSNEIGLCANYKIANLTLEKDRLANEIIKQNFDEEIFAVLPTYKLVKLLKDIEEKASDKGYKVILKSVAPMNFWDKLRNYYSKIYPIYKTKLEELKLNLGTITTNDLITYAVKVLKNKSIAPYIINSFEYLFLDEAQDINNDQAELIELLIDYGIKVFVVGDEKQSIYGFRGSDKNAFHHLISHIKSNNGVQYTLDVNYRSNKFIIDKMNNLFARTFKYKDTKLNFNNQKLLPKNAKDDEKNCISIKFNEVLAEIVNKMTYFIDYNKSVSYNGIVVLCRTNKDVIATYNELKRANIPTQLYLGKSIYKSKTIIDFCKLLNYIVGGGAIEKEELFYTDFYISAKANSITDKEFYDIIDKTKITFKEEGLLPTLAQNIDELHLADYYLLKDNKQALANIQRFTEILRDLANEGMNSIEILNYINIMITTGQDESQPQVKQDNSVIVSTIHTFKGLDGEVVIVNGIDNNINKLYFADFHYTESVGLSFNKDSLLPNSSIDDDPNFVGIKKQIIIENLEEELRVMYVMLTRARNKIVLLSKKPKDKVDYIISHNKEYVSYLRWIYNF